LKKAAVQNAFSNVRPLAYVPILNQQNAPQNNNQNNQININNNQNQIIDLIIKWKIYIVVVIFAFFVYRILISK